MENNSLKLTSTLTFKKTLNCIQAKDWLLSVKSVVE